MFLERNIFYLKYGTSKTALQLWKEYLQLTHHADKDLDMRLLTDLTGPAYVLALELTYSTYSELKPSKCKLTQQPSWKEFYQKFIPLCDKSERTLYKLELAY